MYSMVIKVFDHITFVYFQYPVDGVGSVKSTATKMTPHQGKARCPAPHTETQRNYRTKYVKVTGHH